jgi:hypothetical protein
VFARLGEAPGTRRERRKKARADHSGGLLDLIRVYYGLLLLYPGGPFVGDMGGFDVP